LIGVVSSFLGAIFSFSRLRQLRARPRPRSVRSADAYGVPELLRDRRSDLEIDDEYDAHPGNRTSIGLADWQRQYSSLVKYLSAFRLRG